MMPEVFRILKMMMDLGLNQTHIRITTNGSILTKRVQEALENLKIFPVISFDAVKKETFESIRLNSKFETIVANVHRFKEIVERNGADVTFSVCLMRQNWQEFIDVLLFAEDLGCRSQLSFVVWPDFCSLSTLPRSELAEIIKQMEKRGEELLPNLHLNTVTLIHALELLRGTLDDQRSKEMKQLSQALEGVVQTSEERRSIDKAWLYIRAGEYRKAIAQVEKIPATHGDYYFALNVKGHAQKLLREFDAAQSTLDEAIRVAPARPEAYHEKAFLFYDQGNALEALEVAEQYLVIDPDSYHTWVMKGTFLRLMKNLNDAALSLSNAIDLNKNQPEAFIERAWLNLDLGHWEGGLDDVSRAQALLPPPHLQAPLSNVMGFLWLEAGQPDQAAVSFKRFCEIQPENPKAWVYLARAQQATGDWIGAMETLSEALRLDPHDPEALEAMGRVQDSQQLETLAKKNTGV